MVLAWVDTDVVRVRGDEQVQTVNKQWEPAKTIDGVSLSAQCSKIKDNALLSVTNNCTKGFSLARKRFKR